MNDNELLVAFHSGDDEALKYLYAAHFRSLCYFALGFISDKEEAENIVVEVFIKLLRKRNDFDDLIKLKEFLYSATKNASFDFLRHVPQKTVSQKEILHWVDKDEDFIESRIIKAEALKMVLDEIDQLPDLRKKIFKLVFLERLTTSQIAEELNITVDSVRVQKARTLHSLHSVILKKGLL